MSKGKKIITSIVIAIMRCQYEGLCNLMIRVTYCMMTQKFIYGLIKKMKNATYISEDNAISITGEIENEEKQEGSNNVNSSDVKFIRL